MSASPTAQLRVGDVRVDDGVREGDAISPFYDSMIAKLIVHGDARQALARLDAALAETRIVGLATNVQFCARWCQRGLCNAKLDTALIERERALFGQERGPRPAVAAAVAQALQAERAQEGADPFSRRDGWRSHGVAERRSDFRQGEAAVPARLRYLQTARRSWPGEGEPRRGPAAWHRPGTAPRRAWRPAPARRGPCAGRAMPSSPRARPRSPGRSAGPCRRWHEGGRLTAPMPGKVVSLPSRPATRSARASRWP
jgi:3-methylcrotonyl-CoA carboxylase alpha subunit